MEGDAYRKRLDGSAWYQTLHVRRNDLSMKMEANSSLLNLARNPPRSSPLAVQACGFQREAGRRSDQTPPPFRYEAGHHSNQRPAGFGTEDNLLSQQLWHQLPRDERGDCDAGKEKADHESVETNASAYRKRDQLDCDRAGNSMQYGAG